MNTVTISSAVEESGGNITRGEDLEQFLSDTGFLSIAPRTLAKADHPNYLREKIYAGGRLNARQVLKESSWNEVGGNTGAIILLFS